MRNATIVFDWNGTLLDDADAILETVNIMLAHLGESPIDMATLREKCSFPFSTLYTNLGLTQSQIDELHKDGSAIFHDNYEASAAQSPLRAGVKEMLNEVKSAGVRTLILSNHLVEPIAEQLLRLGIAPDIDKVLAYASRATQYKDMTKGERLRLYMAREHIDPRNTLIIGDTVEEREIAENLGLISVSITGGVVSEARLQATKPDYLIHHYRELSLILKQRGMI